jgi:hypothetical protein
LTVIFAPVGVDVMTSLPGCMGVCDDKIGEQSTAQHRAILMAGDIL